MDKNSEVYKTYMQLSKEEGAILLEMSKLRARVSELDNLMMEIRNKHEKSYIVRVFAEVCMDIAIPALTEEDAKQTAMEEVGNWDLSGWDGFCSDPLRAEIVCEADEYDEKTMKLGRKYVPSVTCVDEEK